MGDHISDHEMFSLGSLIGVAVSLSALAGAVPIAAAAESFPSGVIRIIAPAPTSSPPDIISRVIAQELSASEGWRVIVEDKPGVGGIAGGSDVLQQPADGMTLFALAIPDTVAPALMSMPFHLDTDFVPVIKVVDSSSVLVVNPLVPARSVAEFIALLRSHPDEMTFSSGVFGTPAHLIGELFKLETGVRARHVPYLQLSQAIGDLLNGTNQYQFITVMPVIDLINSGKLRALAVTRSKRVPAIKDVPTIVEEGLPNLVVEDWIGFSAKRGTPAAVIARLNQAINKALAKPNVREALSKLGAEAAGGTPAEFGDLLKFQLAYWGKVVRDSGIKMPQ
jgi:tripartite-type tricarboxylate transporter receptor subunit TctC